MVNLLKSLRMFISKENLLRLVEVIFKVVQVVRCFQTDMF